MVHSLVTGDTRDDASPLIEPSFGALRGPSRRRELAGPGHIAPSTPTHGTSLPLHKPQGFVHLPDVRGTHFTLLTLVVTVTTSIRRAPSPSHPMIIGCRVVEEVGAATVLRKDLL